MKPKLMKNFDKTSKALKNVLKQHYNKSEIEKLITNARGEYEIIIPHIPYIGGKDNIHDFSLIGSTWMLALIRTLEKEDVSVRDIGKIVYDTFEEYFKSMPGVAKWILRRTFFSKSGEKRWMRNAEKSQVLTYPDDWIFEYVKGDDETFDFGIDYTECAINKFYKKQGAEKYIPYMCLGDYPIFKTLGIGLKRTQTIGNGAPICDFRVILKGATPSGWPPENLKEFKYLKNK